MKFSIERAALVKAISQAQSVVEQGRFRIDIRGLHLFQVQAFDKQLGKFKFGVGLI